MAEENKEQKNKKISKMKLNEIEQALKKARDNNNIDIAKYVQHLNQRKAELSVK